MRIDIEWFDWQPLVDVGATAFIEATDVELARALTPVFARGPDPALRPAMSGTFVVPGGPVRVECRRVDGSLAWERSLDPRGEAARVTIGSADR